MSLFFIESVGAMAAVTFTTIATFEMVLFGKALIALWGEVIIAFFEFYFFLRK
jgi:hypothetical protein